MKYIKSIVVLGILFVSTTAFIINKSSSTKVKPKVQPKELVWHTNFEEVVKLANEENKVIFAFFTGSDWCGWCTRLQKNVFSKPAFKEWADKNVILLELDFPRRTALPEKLKQQNRQLQQTLGVRGYPTIWLFDATYNQVSKKLELKTYGKGGYPSGAVAGKEEVKFIETMNSHLSKK